MMNSSIKITIVHCTTISSGRYKYKQLAAFFFLKLLTQCGKNTTGLYTKSYYLIW